MKNFFSNFYHKFIRYKFYDNIESINYKQLCEFEKFPSELYRVKLFEQLDTKKITSVLDYGCGYGLNMKIIKKLNQNIKLNCMEISDEKSKMLNIINENDVLEKSLELGADDFESDDDVIEITTSIEAFGNVSSGLEQQGYEIEGVK